MEAGFGGTQGRSGYESRSKSERPRRHRRRKFPLWSHAMARSERTIPSRRWHKTHRSRLWAPCSVALDQQSVQDATVNLEIPLVFTRLVPVDNLLFLST
eukprot:6178083-Pleurochrysis_carterae.AAC.2